MVNTQPALYKLAPAGRLPAAVLLLQFPGSRRQWLQQPSWVHTMATCWQGLWAYRSYLIVFLLPIFLLPLPILVPTKEAYCAYSIILMALFWCTEALPLAVTALFPIILYPMMGIMDASEVCIEYFKDTNILFVGGLLVAIAVEHWNLHKRIALCVLLIIGVRPALLLLGFMLVTAFLSMWISNTATTAMMVPIAHAVLEQLYKTPTGKDVEEGSDNPTFELQEPSPQKDVTKLDNGQVHPVPPASSEPKEQKDRQRVRFSQGMSLCVCYSASIGGIATLTGTTPNLVLQGQVNSLFPENGNVVNFASWFGFAFPTMVILLLLAWLWLQVLFLGFNFLKNFGFGGHEREQERAAFHIIQTEHKLLGPMTFAEKAVSVLFVILVVLWFTREPGFFLGWGNLAFPDKDGKSMASDGTVAIFIGIIMFLVPSKIPGLTQDPDKPGRLKAPPALLNWKTVNEKMPWNIVFLLGGGFALAKGSEKSGLSEWLGDKLTPLQNVPPPAIAFILCLLIATFTECTSNVATTTLFLPILASMAQAICLHPLYVMLPCTLSASLAFMLPVATPPNAIVFSFGGLKVSDMARTGFLLNIIGVLVITLAINSWSFPIFSLYTFPSWAYSNTTAHCMVNQANTTTARP
ncbi:solute carrier family 13 member 2 isoform X1 [Leopardus geoffroyi]|uniref:solute carrier family 13 member 2 isoform X1 n=2 Tax=Leopardus geoffroyi TaxID=46844 RepID=UPI001E261326|nr:solute carrier family 13 member 2 isoform X1 [Leopardus geoffroyi]